MAKIFKSKIDSWILVMLIALVVVDFGVIISIAAHPEDPLATTVTILVCIAAMALISSLLARTYYSVNKNVLRIVSGPFQWTVALDQITSVSPSRNPLSSPDKQSFLRAIGQEFE